MSKLTNEGPKDKGDALERKLPPFCFRIEDSGGGQMHDKLVRMRGTSWIQAPVKTQAASCFLQHV